MSILLAFSGGLDTSFCVPFLAETYGEDIITVTINTGGFTPQELKEIEARSLSLGARGHIALDGRTALFDEHISYLIKGNVLRGHTYPLCVGPERVVQAHHLVAEARRTGADTIAHGSTGAGNDQVRFDVALGILASDIRVLAPIREGGLDRSFTSKYLKDRGFSVSESTTTYSINSGLWGTTIGGGETLTTGRPLPDAAYPRSVAPRKAPDEGRKLSIGFLEGSPVSVDGDELDPVTLIERITHIGHEHGIGRGIHVGDTILGIKGRVAFEAPAAEILISAHRELEKIVLGKWQRYQKDRMAEFYGMLLHEGQYLDPVMADIRAMIDSSQERVTGVVDVSLYKGRSFVEGCESAYSLFKSHVATYGETNRLWDGRDARGFSRIVGVQAALCHEMQQTEVGA